MKTCRGCHGVKPMNQFQAHPLMGDGHLNYCRDCRREREREYRARKRLDPEWLTRERARCRAKTAKDRRDGKVKYTSAHREYNKKWYCKNKQKKFPHCRVYYAVKTGKIAKPNHCSQCGAVGGRIEGHHSDYSKPLAVQWLCTKCHGLTRRKAA